MIQRDRERWKSVYSCSDNTKTIYTILIIKIKTKRHTYAFFPVPVWGYRPTYWLKYSIFFFHFHLFIATSSSSSALSSESLSTFSSSFFSFSLGTLKPDNYNRYFDFCLSLFNEADMLETNVHIPYRYSKLHQHLHTFLWLSSNHRPEGKVLLTFSPDNYAFLWTVAKSLTSR